MIAGPSQSVMILVEGLWVGAVGGWVCVCGLGMRSVNWWRGTLDSVLCLAPVPWLEGTASQAA